MTKTTTKVANRHRVPGLLIALSALAMIGGCDKRAPATPDGGVTAPTTPAPTAPSATTTPAPMAPASAASQ